MAGKSSITFESLLADRGAIAGTGDMWLTKEAQEQPDNVQFAQDFSNLAFQFMQDRAPALMKYLLGFEVVDRAENGTRAVGIFGFKIDGQYYYVPAFFMNSQVKGVDSILSKSTNSFVPLTEEWVNYIINRKANELGKEAPESQSQGGMEGFENPNFDFLQHPTVGSLGGHSLKSASAPAEDPSPWSLSRAWSVIRDRTEGSLGKDAGFTESVVGAICKLRGARQPFGKRASSPVQAYISSVGGPRADRTMLRSLRNVKMANAALEFYTGPEAFHVGRFDRTACHALRKEAQEIEEARPKVEIVSDANSEAEARDIVQNGFTIRDSRPDDEKSDVVDTDYEKTLQNPDRSGVYNVLVNGGETRRAYVVAADRLFHKGQAGGMMVYFPDNGQLISAKSKDILCEGGCLSGYGDVYGDASSIGDCRIGEDYIFIGPNGTSLPKFRVTNVRRESEERPVIGGSFEYDDLWQADVDDDFTNHWRSDDFHDRSGLAKPFGTFSICNVELADFDGRPKLSHGTVVLPKGWKALHVVDEYMYDYGYGYGDMSSEDASNDSRKRKYGLGTLNQLTLELRKEGAVKFDIRHDDDGWYYSFDGAPFTQPMGYKQASIRLVTRYNVRWDDAKDLLKKAEDSGGRGYKCLLKMAQIMPSQLVGVDPAAMAEQTPSADPYTGIPVYDSPYYDATEMQMNGVPEVPQDNEYGENLGGEISRQSAMGGDPTGDAEMDPEAMQLASDAAQAGQKEVFDKAAIGGLAKVYDTGAVIDSYLPEFMTAVDRLGRTLFLFYWRHNDFIDRYGTDDVIEMEDVLRSTFKQLGKLTMDLRRKSVGGGDGDTDSDLLS